MKPNDNIKNEIKNISFKASNELKQKMLEDVLNEQNKKQHSTQTPQSVWRIIMKSNITKLAAAAIVIAAILVGINRFGGSIDGSSVAWAHVTEKVNQIHTYAFNLHTTFTAGPKGPHKMEAEAFFSSEHGLRFDMYMDGKPYIIQHMDMENKTMTAILPEQKTYMTMLLNDEQFQNMNQKGDGDPRYLVEQFLSFEYTELGLDVIDGIEVEGIETSDPRYRGGVFDSFTGRLWVDVETDLPIRLEIETRLPKIGETDMGTRKMVMDSFQWDIDIDPAIFEPDIPEDYTSHGDIKVPTSNEKNAVEGLRLFAEMTDGKYPEKLNITSAMDEITKHVAPNLNKMITVQGASRFYAVLTRDSKEPAYYGDIVTAGDPDAVLMRWKVYDGQYRVIFGDLTIENVTAEQLAELESQLPLPPE